jgi:hypothetical protein
MLHVPTGRAERIAMEIRRAVAIEEAQRQHLRFLVRAGMIPLAFLLAGVFLMGLAFHLTEQKYADLAFQVSFLVGYGGIFFSVIGIYVYGRNRGEFE